MADWKKGKCKGEKGKGKYLTEKDQSTGCAHNMVNMVKMHTQEHTDHNLRLVMYVRSSHVLDLPFCLSCQTFPENSDICSKAFLAAVSITISFVSAI